MQLKHAAPLGGQQAGLQAAGGTGRITYYRLLRCGRAVLQVPDRLLCELHLHLHLAGGCSLPTLVKERHRGLGTSASHTNLAPASVRPARLT